MQLKAQRSLEEGFEAFLAAPYVLPQNVQDIIPRRGLHRTVCDYLAGMTDRYALQEHSRMFDPKSGV